MMGFDMAAIRDPVTGRDPLGSLYHDLIRVVDRWILKKDVGGDGDGLGTRVGDCGMDEGGEDGEMGEGGDEDGVNGNGRGEGRHDVDEAGQGEKDSRNGMNGENVNHGDADTVMEG